MSAEDVNEEVVIEDPSMAAGAPAAEDEKEIPKPEMTAKRPDEAEFTAAVEAAQARMDGYHKRIAEIKESLNSREQVRNASSSESGQAKARLQELRGQARAVATERNAIYNSISEQEDLRKARTAALSDLKKAVPYASVEEIERAMKEKEHYQETNALKLNEVKKVMAELKEMQAAKPRVKELHELGEQLKRDKELQNVLYANLKEKTAEMNSVRDLERKQSDDVDKIRKKEEGNRSDVPGLVKECDECKRQIGSCREEMKKLRDEFNTAKKLYFDQQRLLKRWQMQERKKEWLAREAERSARRKDRETEEAARVPWEDEMALVDQLLVYVARYLPAAKPEPSAAPSAAAFVGRKPVEEDYFVGAKAKAKKGKKAPEAATLKVTHTPEVFASFDKLQLRPPMLAGDCADAIVQLKAKKEYFKTAPPKAELKRREDEARRAAAAVEEAAKKAEDEAREAEESKAAKKAGAAKASEKVRRRPSRPRGGRERASESARQRRSRSPLTQSSPARSFRVPRTPLRPSRRSRPRRSRACRRVAACFRSRPSRRRACSSPSRRSRAVTTRPPSRAHCTAARERQALRSFRRGRRRAQREPRALRRRPRERPVREPPRAPAPSS
jgi:hypothetical protein